MEIEWIESCFVADSIEFFHNLSRFDSKLSDREPSPTQQLIQIPNFSAAWLSKHQKILEIQPMKSIRSGSFPSLL
jgi:hypothetical protein